MSVARNPDRRFTYGDYLTWTDEGRWELLEGVPHAMSPAPGVPHQRLVVSLSRQLDFWFEGKPCEPFTSPIDVRFPLANQTDEQAETVLQPDLLVVCDQAKVNSRGITGAPDFVIEILSPGTASHDQIRKRDLYQLHGVKEYWIVDPAEQLVTIRLLSRPGEFSLPQILEARGRVPVSIFAGLEIDFDLAFSRFAQPAPL